MKKTLRMKFMLLLFALVAGISNVWADDTYVKVTNSNQVSSGSQIIFVCEDNNQAMTSSSNYPGTSVTISNSTITLTSTSTVCVLTVGGSAGAYTFTYGTNTQLSWAKNGFSTNQTSDNKNLWTIASDGSFTNNVSNSVTDASTRKQVRHNTNNTNKFGCYTSSTGAAVCLYVKQTTPAYTITAESNNTNYGTVSLNGSVITGSPKSGYRYASPAYTVNPANSATVEQDGNLFTVTPSANTTVTINFEAIPSHTATFSVNGATSTQDFLEGATITFPSNISPVYGKPFMGWLGSTIDGTTDEEPEFVTSATMSTANVTYYAVFATATAGDPVETKTQTLQYDTWTKGGSSTDKSSYRLFHNGGYVESSSFDLSKLSKVIVYGGTFGGSSYNSLNIGDGTNTWKNVTVTGSSHTGENTYTKGTALTGTKALRVKSTCGSTSGTGSGIRMSKVEIYTMETSYTYSAYCTTVPAPAVIQPEITVAETFFFSTTVSISCETEGASIKYSFDNENWNDYTEPFNITTTETIYAKAVKGAVWSAVAQATATKQLAEPTVTIITSGITNKNVYSGTTAGYLTATVKYNDETIDGASVTWTGDANAVATINPTSGAVTLVAAGSVTFTATYAGNADYSSKTATYTMVVINVDPSAPSYTLVTSTSQIIPGAHYVLSSSKTKDATAYIMDEQSGTYRLTETATILEDNEDGRIYIQKSSLYEFVISGFTDNYTIYDETNGTPGYLSHTSDKSVGVTNTLSNSGKWKITFDNDKAIINNFGSQSYYLEFNTSANPKRVTDYAGTQPDGYLYIKDSDPDIHPYSSSEYTSGSVTINDAITLSANYNITVGAGATLTFTGTLSCTNPAWLVIEDGGQLILNNTSSAVQATIQKNIEAVNGNNGWYTIASPIGDVATASVTNLLSSDEDETYNLYRYDEPAGHWDGNASFTQLDKGHGYIYRNNDGRDLSFSGTVNVSKVENMYLSYTPSAGVGKAGFHLIGNPFAEDITMSNITGETFSGGYVLTNAGAWSTSPNSTTIHPCEGFLVQVGAEKTITIKRTADDSKYNQEYVQFIVANNQYEDAAFALFDKGYGLNKINHRNAEIPMIYIHQNGQDYAIATMNDDVKSFNLNFKAATTGQYTLKYKATGEYSYLHVIDRFTGEDIDMLLEGEYSFIGSPSDSDARFIVKLGYMPDYSDAENDIFAFQNGSEILVSGEGELQIFDVTGRKVMTTTINGVEAISGLQQGVYIFRVIGETQKTQKIVVR